MPVSRACATGLRTNATSRIRGKAQVADVLAAAVEEALVFLAAQSAPTPVLAKAEHPRWSFCGHATRAALFILSF